MKIHTIKFLPGKREITVSSGKTLLEAARENGIMVAAPCGGRGLCGGCAVRISLPESLAATEEDRRHLSQEQIDSGFRLACQLKVKSDLTVHLAEKAEMPGAKLELLKVESEDIEPQGVPRKILFTVGVSSLEELNIPLEDALNQAFAPGGSRPVALRVIEEFASLVGQEQKRLTLIAEKDSLIGVEPGDTTGSLLAAAVDIGTTTIALYLCDLIRGKILASSAVTNSQSSYGSDVMSRIGYCAEKPAGLEQLGRLVREDLTGLLDQACAKAGEKAEHVYRWVLVGNTTMQHLFLGLDPSTLGRAPYLPLVNGAVDFIPHSLGLPGARCARGLFLPTVAGHVGADTVAVALAARLENIDNLSLAVDLGTNGEIVLAERGRLLCCSTAAGPAFEGMRITHGMRAESGAIDRFWISSDGEPGFHVIGNGRRARGICGSGLMDIAAGLLKAGIIDQSGWILPPEKIKDSPGAKLKKRLSRGENGQWQFVIDEYKEKGKTSRIILTQQDVRELQLASGAISSGISILLKLAGRSADQVDQLLLTGAFGHFLNPASALAIGLIRGVSLERIQSIGNAAGLGARLAAFSDEEAESACRIASRMKFVELGAHPDWNDEFSESMFFPEIPAH